MTNSDLDPRPTSTPHADRVVCADSVGRALLAMAVPPDQRRGDILRHIPVLGRHGGIPEPRRRELLAADAADQAVPLAQIDHIDADAIAAWIVDHHRASAYPAVVVGSAHGAAVHLAAAIGAAWLPTSFTVTAPWPGGDAGDWISAMLWGSHLAERILARNPAVSVRQTHDPVLRGPLCGATVTLNVRWRAVPTAYQTFLASRLTPGGSTVMVRDLRPWPALNGLPGYSFQLGSPTSGWAAADHTLQNRAFRRLLNGVGAVDWPVSGLALRRQYAETSGDPAFEPELRRLATGLGSPAHRVVYTDAQALSAIVADLYRAWLPAPSSGRHCAVVTGRLTDPWAVLDAGMVPYWCESSSRSVTEAAELWLAGSEPFDSISVLPDPPGIANDATASTRHWRGVGAFAHRKAQMDDLIARHYPLLPPAAGHATRHLDEATGERIQPAKLPAAEAVMRLKECSGAPGLLVV
ncbi:hypothetical protein OHA21_05955 [Actinoplanes sp. NBC_00393]|uniref:hypothetical protein n=1 Tax=Actinoplanes sp. NBC_00393 TaxID=2975953 RepID=UPI002E1D1CCA